MILFFDVSVTCQHPQAEKEFRDEIHVDLKDFLYSEMEKKHLKNISDDINKLQGIINATSRININDRLKNIERISGATGLNLSISSLSDISKVLRGDDSFKYVNLENCDTDIIQEVLGVDFNMAANIYEHYHFNSKGTSFDEIHGMTEYLLEKIKKHEK